MTSKYEELTRDLRQYRWLLTTINDGLRMSCGLTAARRLAEARDQ